MDIVEELEARGDDLSLRAARYIRMKQRMLGERESASQPAQETGAAGCGECDTEEHCKRPYGICVRANAETPVAPLEHGAACPCWSCQV